MQGRWKVYIVYIGYMHNLILYHPCRTIHTDFCNSHMKRHEPVLNIGKLHMQPQHHPQKQLWHNS